MGPLPTLICGAVLLSGAGCPLGMDLSLKHTGAVTAEPKSVMDSEILICKAHSKKLQEALVEIPMLIRKPFKHEKDIVFFSNVCPCTVAKNRYCAPVQVKENRVQNKK